MTEALESHRHLRSDPESKYSLAVNSVRSCLHCGSFPPKSTRQGSLELQFQRSVLRSALHLLIFFAVFPADARAYHYLRRTLQASHVGKDISIQSKFDELFPLLQRLHSSRGTVDHREQNNVPRAAWASWMTVARDGANEHSQQKAHLASLRVPLSRPSDGTSQRIASSRIRHTMRRVMSDEPDQQPSKLGEIDNRAKTDAMSKSNSPSLGHTASDGSQSGTNADVSTYVSSNDTTAGKYQVVPDGEDEESQTDRSQRPGSSKVGAEYSEPVQRVAALQISLKEKANEVESAKRKRDYLAKSITLKKGEMKMQKGEKKLYAKEAGQAEKQLESLLNESTRADLKYSQLQGENDKLLSKSRSLRRRADTFKQSTDILTLRLQQLSVEDVIARRTRNMPESLAGAIRKSVDLFMPFADTFAMASDTNNRLVDRVGSEIDKYTRVDVRLSPFLHGLLFYIFLLIPLVTVILCARKLSETSSRLSVSHFIVLGNLHYMAICLFAIVASLTLGRDSTYALYKSRARLFVSFNLSLALYFLWHVGMLTLQALLAFDKCNWAQVVATACVGLHYYLFTWRPVFIDAPPHMLITNYCVYFTIFGIIVIERCSRVNVDWGGYETISSFFKYSGGYARSFGPSWFHKAGGMNRESLYVDDMTWNRRIPDDEHYAEAKALSPKGSPVWTPWSGGDDTPNADATDEDIVARRDRDSSQRRRRQVTKDPGGFISIFFGNDVPPRRRCTRSPRTDRKRDEADAKQNRVSWFPRLEFLNRLFYRGSNMDTHEKVVSGKRYLRRQRGHVRDDHRDHREHLPTGTKWFSKWS